MNVELDEDFTTYLLFFALISIILIVITNEYINEQEDKKQQEIHQKQITELRQHAIQAGCAMYNSVTGEFEFMGEPQ